MMSDASEIRVRLLGTPAEELAGLQGEVPRWVARLWEARRPERLPGQEVSLSDRLAALAAVLKHRVESVAFLVERVEEMGWTVDALEDGVVARKDLDLAAAELELDSAGVLVLVRLLGTLGPVSDPRIVSAHQETGKQPPS